MAAVLENTPWEVKRIDLSLKRDKNRMKATKTEDASDSTSDAAPARTFPVELRWGVPVTDLRAVWTLHEQSFPISYDVAYYRWLTEQTCLSLTAYTTPEALATLTAAPMTDKHQTANTASTLASTEEDEEEEAASESSLREISATIVATEARLRGDVAAAAGTADSIAREAHVMAEVDKFITEVEYQTERDAQRAAGANPETAAGENAPPSSACTEVVGFVCSQLSFAQGVKTGLFTNPTGYIGSLAVLPAVRCLGLGAELLRAMLNYLCTSLPLRASYYLHYDQYEMRAIAWGLVKKDLKKEREREEEKTSRCPDGKDGSDRGEPEGQAVATGDGSSGNHTQDGKKPEEQTYGFWETLTQFAIPEAASFLERRKTKRELIAGGMSEEAAEAEVERRIRAADTPMTDEMAEEDFFSSLSEERRRTLVDPVVQVGVRDVWLHCMKEDGPLKRFYAKHGFTTAVERVPDYYELGDGWHDASLLLYAKRHPSTSDTAADGLDAVHARKDASLMETVEGAAATGVPVDEAADLATLVEQKRRAKLAQLEHLRAMSRQSEKRDERQKTEADASSTLRKRTHRVDSAEDTNKGAPKISGRNHASEVVDATANGTPQTTPWLSPSTYHEVDAVHLLSVDEARREWLKRWGRQRTWARRKRRQERPQSWKDNMMEIALTLNAVACLLAVLYYSYYHGPWTAKKQ